MYHSLTVSTTKPSGVNWPNDPIVVDESRNTWDDWHLIPASRPTISAPTVKETFVEIPGVDGELNLSYALTGYPVYGNRKGSMSFVVCNDYGEWSKRYSDILSFVQGKPLRITLEDDPNYYYEGFLTLKEWVSGKTNSMISFEYNLYPFKIDAQEQYWFFILDGTEDKEITINVGEKRSVLEILVLEQPEMANNITLYFNNETYDLSFPFSNLMWNFPFKKGANKLVFKGSGNIRIKYRGGDL